MYAAGILTHIATSKLFEIEIKIINPFNQSHIHSYNICLCKQDIAVLQKIFIVSD